MNTQSNATPESFQAQSVASGQVSAGRLLYWSVRRELWEYRSIYLAPLAAAAVFLFGFLISLIHLPARMRGLAALDAAHQHALIARHYDIAAGLLMIVAMIVGAFYCLDAFNSERRDRSILFWKSLPVSDVTTVLAKACIPLVVLPLVAFTVTVALQWIMLLLSTVVLLGSGVSVAPLWVQLSFVQMSLLLLYHLVTVHSLWHAPFYGWLLLVSSWARRAAILWAVLPVLVIAIVEKMVFNSAHFVGLLEYHLSAGGTEAVTAAGTMPIDTTTHITPIRFLSTPGLWTGLALTAVFLAAAVRLRRDRGPI
jgi:ABC-2 type transport system permease protein